MKIKLNTTIQLPDAGAGRRGDMDSTNFNNVFFARGERDVPGLLRESFVQDYYYILF